MITQDYLKSILNYNSETGLFTWIISTNYRRIKVGDIAGTLIKSGYVHIRINSKNYYAHRLAWLYVTGDWPKNDIDHVNMNKNDNKFINLREATKTQNQGNQLKYKRNTSGFKGVFWHKNVNKWMSAIGINNKLIHLGYYNSKEDAANAYKEAAIKHFGEFARL